jgi:hypothetical protein
MKGTHTRARARARTQINSHLHTHTQTHTHTNKLTLTYTNTHVRAHAHTHKTNYNSIINQDTTQLTNKYNITQYPQGARGPQVKNGCSTFAMSRYKRADKERV